MPATIRGAKIDNNKATMTMENPSIRLAAQYSGDAPTTSKIGFATAIGHNATMARTVCKPPNIILLFSCFVPLTQKFSLPQGVSNTVIIDYHQNNGTDRHGVLLSWGILLGLMQADVKRDKTRHQNVYIS